MGCIISDRTKNRKLYNKICEGISLLNVNSFRKGMEPIETIPIQAGFCGHCCVAMLAAVLHSK